MRAHTQPHPPLPPMVLCPPTPPPLCPGALSALGAPLVGLAAQSLFHFQGTADSARGGTALLVVWHLGTAAAAAGLPRPQPTASAIPRVRAPACGLSLMVLACHHQPTGRDHI
jgi:hypothetical protein